MGILDQVLGSVLGQQQGYEPTGRPQGGLPDGRQGGMSPILTALMALLSSGALGRGGSGGGGLGDLLGGLGGRPEGPLDANAGSMGSGTTGTATGTGSTGAFDELVKGFQRSGHGGVMESWVGSGQNRAISPDQLGEALGRNRVDDLSRQTGMSHGDLLSELSRMLPTAVDRLTPQGRPPNGDEMSRW